MLQAEVLDVRTGGLRHAKAVQRGQGDQRMLSRHAEPVGDQQRAELGSVQRDCVGLAVSRGRRTWAAVTPQWLTSVFSNQPRG